MLQSLKHPTHNVPEEVTAGLRKVYEIELAKRSRQNEIAQLSRPNEEERRRLTEFHELSSESRGFTHERLQILRDIQKKKSSRVREALEFDADIARQGDVPVPLPPWDFEPPIMADFNFWWAETTPFASQRVPSQPDEGSNASFTIDWRSDGLHFFGGVTTHDGDLYFDNFGAWALFELQAERIPHTQESRQWRSTPHVELVGGLFGYTGDNDIFTGDLWSKCWLHLDQKIYQWGFGPNGPGMIELGHAHEVETLIFEENGNRTAPVSLPGFKWMPPVTFGGINLANSLWVRLEVRFDIQTEGAGSLLYLNPEVLLRTFQWPLEVVF
jgi:hypothetical protein